MACNYVDAGMITKMFLAGAQNLEAQKERINELNVFPVPDGDTGTNMTMTILSAAKEVAALENPDMESVAKAIASGSLDTLPHSSGLFLVYDLLGLTHKDAYRHSFAVSVLVPLCVTVVATIICVAVGI